MRNLNGISIKQKSEDIQDLHRQVDEWNKNYPIGTKVMRYKLINPLEEGNQTETRSKAWVLSGHSVVVKVASVAGCVSLSSVVPLEET